MDRRANVSGERGYDNCISSITSWYIFTAWFTVHLFFLPVFLFVLYIGFNKWKKPQSSASGGLSHSDVFTLNMVAMEMISIAGSCIVFFGYIFIIKTMLIAGDSLFTTALMGQTMFHSLTCVERYLAVVHPVTYLRLRGEGGVTIRNITIAFIWVSTAGNSLAIGLLNHEAVFGGVGFTVSFASLPIVAYCSIYVLCVLTRPKPGERGGHKKPVDQSKRTTVYTMAAILGALLLRLVFYVVFSCINLWFWYEVNGCVVVAATFGIALPSSLVLPLLFLHRAGKLPSLARA